MAQLLSFLNGLLPAAGTAAGAYFGGPAGAQLGGSAGGALSSGLSSLGAPPRQPNMGATAPGNHPQVQPIQLPQISMSPVGQISTPQPNPSISSLIQGLMAARGS